MFNIKKNGSEILQEFVGLSIQKFKHKMPDLQYSESLKNQKGQFKTKNPELVQETDRRKRKLMERYFEEQTKHYNYIETSLNFRKKTSPALRRPEPAQRAAADKDGAAVERAPGLSGSELEEETINSFSSQKTKEEEASTRSEPGSARYRDLEKARRLNAFFYWAHQSRLRNNAQFRSQTKTANRILSNIDLYSEIKDKVTPELELGLQCLVGDQSKDLKRLNSIMANLHTKKPSKNNPNASKFDHQVLNELEPDDIEDLRYLLRNSSAGKKDGTLDPGKLHLSNMYKPKNLTYALTPFENLDHQDVQGYLHVKEKWLTEKYLLDHAIEKQNQKQDVIQHITSLSKNRVPVEPASQTLHAQHSQSLGPRSSKAVDASDSDLHEKLLAVPHSYTPHGDRAAVKKALRPAQPGGKTGALSRQNKEGLVQYLNKESERDFRYKKFNDQIKILNQLKKLKRTY